MVERRDLYTVLGIERDATEEQIKSAYRRLAREHHPDVNPGDTGAEERFKEISVAKEILLSKEKRALYDEFGFDGLASGFDASEARAYRDWSRRASRSPGFGGYSSGDGFGAAPGGASGIDVEDLLSQLFGASQGEGPSYEGFQGRGRASSRRGGDLEARLEVDFVDAVVGNEVSLEIQGRSPLRVTLPRGVKDGARIRLGGQGQPAPAGGGGKAGDLYLRIAVRPHPVFRREGNDLHVDVPVTVPELILGAEIKVPTPDGRVDVRIPPRSANGRTLRLREKGIAAGKSDSSRGHLFLHLVAVLPGDADPAVEEIAKKLEPFYGDVDPRAALRWEMGK